MSCLFNSFATLTGESSDSIRGKICDWLATDPLLADDMRASEASAVESGLPLERYVERMRSMSTWGGAIEIRAFVELWKRPVRVWVLRTRRWIEFPYSEGDEYKISWSGGHYEAMR